MIAIDTAQLRHRVGIQTETSVQDSSGQDQQVWADVAMVSASIKPISGDIKQQAQADMTTATATHQITMRYTPLVTPDCRLRFGPAGIDRLTSAQLAVMSTATFAALTTTGTAGRIFRINKVNDVESRRVVLAITATEILT